MTDQELVDRLSSHPFVLAPMAGITDSPFRRFMRHMGAGVVISELVSATGLKFESTKTRRLMQFEEEERPVGIQIFGSDLDHLRDAASYIEDQGADFVDINFGCPVPKVVKKGAGSACLRDLVQLGQVIAAVKSGCSIPVTIKVRTGWDSDSRNTPEVCEVAHNEGATWVAIHGRTRAQGYSGEADWSFIERVKASSPLPVIGNGDLTHARKAASRLQESRCDGVMIGRGCLKNPWIFQESLALYRGESLSIQRDFSGIFSKLTSYLEEYCDERIQMIQIKKLAGWYSHGYPGSSQFRRELFKQQNKTELLSYVTTFFESIHNLEPEDTSSEGFLMGGHG